jgi:hypothetical protein
VQSVSSNLSDRSPLKATSDGLKARVSDKVKLWRDVIGIDIADKPNRSGMDRGKTEKLTATSAGFPFRNLLAVLKAGV